MYGLFELFYTEMLREDESSKESSSLFSLSCKESLLGLLQMEVSTSYQVIPPLSVILDSIQHSI